MIGCFDRSRTDIFGVSVGCFAATDFSLMVVPLFLDVHYDGIGFAGMKINQFIMYTLVQVYRAYSSLLMIINKIKFTYYFKYLAVL